LVASDFPSVTYPWLAARDRMGMRIRWFQDNPAQDLTLSLGNAISERTTVVCVSAVQFATGSQVDVAALVACARDARARVVVDVTQLAGAAPVTMTQWGVDALVCSGYKWLSAPSGVALLAITEKLAAATPVVVGWKGSAAPFDFTPQELSLAADACRFELSTMSYSAAVGLLTSIRLLTGIGLTAISEHASALAADLAEQTAPLGWTPYRAPGERAHRLAQAPRRRGRPGAGRAGKPAQHPHQRPGRRYPGIPARLQQQRRHPRPHPSARLHQPALNGQRAARLALCVTAYPLRPGGSRTQKPNPPL
jgi:cysteine desulfurase / selenocysteine lyase